MSLNNPWAAKARDLDRYRWLMLRERHGWLGSAVRYVRDWLGDWWFGVRAKSRLANSVATEPCDFLLLQSAPKVIKFQRKKRLVEALRARGHSLVDTALPAPANILSERLLRPPLYDVPTRYFGMAAYAQWLVDRYQPRILLNDRNGSFYAPFLRLALNARQSLLVHLAHATTVESSRRLGMNDYDYYFLFGQSSLDALRARHLRFGSSTVILSGSYLIDQSYRMSPADPHSRVLLVLGVGPDKEKEIGYQRTYRMLSDWSRGNPSYQVLIKAHPRSDASFWREVAGSSDNVRLLPSDCALADALRQASVVVNIMSNAVIEAALARRPVIFANASGEHDIFEQERFFGAGITELPALSERICQIEDDYPAAVQAAERFTEFHLAQGADGLTHVLECLEQLLAGDECVGIMLSSSGVACREHDTARRGE